MKKIKTLIADDELIIRKGLKSLIQKDTDLDVIAEAEDGEKALELIKERDFDLIFVDINMPFINGLVLIEKIKELSPSTYIIIISGFNEFEYAQKAIRLGVNLYLLKPINEEKLYSGINYAKKIIEEKRRDSVYLNWAKDELTKNKEVLINQFLNNILGENSDVINLKENLNNLGINFEDYKFIIMFKCVVIDQINNKEALMYSAIKKIVKEIINQSTILYDIGNYKYLILQNDNRINENKINLLIAKLEEKIETQIILKTRKFDSIDNFVDTVEYLENELDKEQILPRVIKQMISFLRLNYFKKELSLSMICDEINVSPQYLSRQMNKYMNTTFTHYLNLLRIEESIYLLKNTDKMMYEIADLVGYSSQHYFSRAFKKIMKVSPVNYQMEFKNDKKN